MKIKICLFMILMILLSLSIAHPYHHTLAILDENKSTKKLELSFKMLSEDYVLINKKTPVPAYVTTHLMLSINGKALKAEYEGMESDVNFTWLYFTYNIDDVGQQPAMISVVNVLLTEIHDKQVNTVTLKAFDQHWSYNFTAGNRRHEFTIE